jgi:hypothetical protein
MRVIADRKWQNRENWRYRQNKKIPPQNQATMLDSFKNRSSKHLAAVWGEQMARCKPYDYIQGKFIPLSFGTQVIPGIFAHTLSYLIDHKLDLSVFDNGYWKDSTDAPAILVEIILYAYPRGIVSSREIEQSCRGSIARPTKWARSDLLWKARNTRNPICSKRG